jgi:hypothetical protein
MNVGFKLLISPTVATSIGMCPLCGSRLLSVKLLISPTVATSIGMCPLIGSQCVTTIKIYMQQTSTIII